MKPEFTGIHAEFLADDTPEIDLEGARSSGKSWVCCAKVIESCLKNPGIEWLASRYSGEETRNKLKPEFAKMCGRYGVEVAWNADAQCYEFPAVDGKSSRVFMYGLKTQDRAGHFAKIRGLGIACVWIDQTEELDESIGLELRAALRQPGYPHQLIFSPNPPNEDHFLADQFPEDNSLPNRKYYRVSLYDNDKNLDPKTIAALEQAYPKTHAKNKSLILGMRGPNVTGTPVYDGAFDRTLHVGPMVYDPQATFYEAFHAGQHHPTWVIAQRTPYGALHLLGGVLGKRLFLDDFLPIVDHYRREWFPDGMTFRVCCDPPPAQGANRYTVLSVLREAKYVPVYRDHGTSPDVRVSMIEYLAGLMQRRAGGAHAFQLSDAPAHWLMASRAVIKQTKLCVDALEGSYVWSPHYVSVGSKTVRQPEFDQWLEGFMRCLENLALNFCVGQTTQREDDVRRAAANAMAFPPLPDSWQSF